MKRFFNKNSLVFVALKKLHQNQDCNHKQKWQLKKRKLINPDCTITVEGMTLLYAGIFQIPVASFKILALCYVYRKLQTPKTELIPVFYKLIESFFGGKPTRYMRECIKYLIDENFAEKCNCQSITITDSAYTKLKQYDAEVVGIERTFEY